MIDEQFGKLLMLRAKAMERAVVASHAAISAVLAAEIGNLNHGPDEDALAETFASQGASPFVQRGLVRAVSDQVRFCGEISGFDHALIKIIVLRLRNGITVSKTGFRVCAAAMRSYFPPYPSDGGKASRT
jgi:hypothetical protein